MTASQLKSLTTALLVFVAACCLQTTNAAASTNAGARRQAQQTPASQTTAEWERYMYPGDEFSVELPAMPFVFHTERSAESYFSKDTVRVFGLYHDEVIFMVVAYDKPGREESPEDLAGYRWSGKRGKTTTTKIKLGDFAGKQFSSQTSTSRFFKTQRRAYLAHALHPEGPQPSVGRFLDSLTLAANPPGKKIIDRKSSYSPPPVARPGPPPGGYAGGGGPSTAPGCDVRSVPGAPRHSVVMRKATIIYRGIPRYTEQANVNTVTGKVRLKAILCGSGKVRVYSVVDPLPHGLTENAIRAAESILFLPILNNGRPVSQYVTLEYTFNIY